MEATVLYKAEVIVFCTFVENSTVCNGRPITVGMQLITLLLEAWLRIEMGSTNCGDLHNHSFAVRVRTLQAGDQLMASTHGYSQ